MTRAELLAYYQEHDRSHDGFSYEDVGEERYILIQRAVERYGSGVWITDHATPEDAASYVLGDEYPEDWLTERLHDTKTGTDLAPSMTITFSPSPWCQECAELYGLKGGGGFLCHHKVGAK